MAETSHQFAGLGSRAVALIIDTILLMIVGTGLVFALFGLPSAGFGVENVVLPVIGLGYFVLLEAYNGGQTLGKVLTNIKVTTDSGQDLTLGGSIVRNVLRIVDALPMFYIIGIILVAVTGDKQRIGDMAAKSVVVKA